MSRLSTDVDRSEVRSQIAELIGGRRHYEIDNVSLHSMAAILSCGQARPSDFVLCVGGSIELADMVYQLSLEAAEDESVQDL